MDADRYERLESLFHDALGLAEKERAVFAASLDNANLDLEHDLSWRMRRTRWSRFCASWARMGGGRGSGKIEGLESEERLAEAP
ncbi:MAG: hypothetical protein ACI8X5_002412 [Planctomycetota bacterium]|jgi:hypothetical protein